MMTSELKPESREFRNWTDDSYEYRDRASSVSFLETGTYTLQSKLKIGAAWFFFAIMAVAYSLVPIFSLLALPALLGCVGILTQAYQSANEERIAPRGGPTQPSLREKALRPVTGRVL